MKLVWRPALLLAGLVLAGLALHWLPAGGASVLLGQLVARPGLSGSALFVGVGALLCAIGVPRQVVAYAAAYAFGFWLGLAAALVAQLLGCIADFYWSRFVARNWARRIMQRRWKGRLAQVDRFLADNPFTATLTLRLLPVGSNIGLNLLAGVSAIAIVPFLAGSALGYMPQTVVFALLGGGARVERSAQVGIGIALFVVSAATGVLLLRRFRNVAVG
jgi:uncharacterized membrane protein YdjX (TVP38/TMEM64 family)